MATKQVQPETVLLTLEVTPAALEAIELLQDALRADTRLYRTLEAQLRRWQGRLEGPLTDALAALVGKE
jgi:hypothetical protein